MAIETIAGSIDDGLLFHYDVFADVLYLTVADAAGEESYGEKDERGTHVMCSLRDDRIVGLTLLSFWRLHGQGERASLTEVQFERIVRGAIREYQELLLAV
jgi:hypothetical protein